MLAVQEFFSKVPYRFKSRMLWRLQCLISPNQIPTFRLCDGSSFDYPLKSAIGRSLFSGSFEKSEVKFVQRSLKPGDIFLDVGANAGFYTIIAAKQVGETGHVYAFEPSPRELKLLRHNLQINKLGNVTIVERAVSNAEERTQFAISQDGAMNSLLKTEHHLQKIQDWQTIESTTLDSFVREFNVASINFIKVDVEGAEKLVFEGASRILSSKNKIIVLFEASDSNIVSFGSSAKEMISELLSQGLLLYYLDQSGKPIEILSKNDARFGKKIYNFVASNYSL